MRGRRWALPALVAALLALAALATGCERRSDAAPEAGEPAAALVATAGYGEEELLAARVPAGDSLMRALRGATDVDTMYGGGFVASMLGHTSDAGAQEDWFFFVDGVSSPVGAKDVTVRDGQDVWWDFRDWGALIDTPAVVGAWPEPFTGPPVAADPPLAAALEAAGADLVEGDTPWRVVVGASDDLARREPAWRRALGEPDAAGLTVAVEDGAITALGPGGAPREAVPGARALVAAVATGTEPSDGVTLVVAGLDAAAARAAAEAVAAEPAILARRYAVAFDGAGTPLRAGGRDGP
ncbi:MAG: DUF4430 domain-containing protein [Thermoleophilia bacterium]